ncbi:glyoxalase [Micromonospora pallida]|uniref:glyoxalase n=1 Tax=Micromonospora pallida TaxID=145854 RepID=UPI001C404FDC|nr:glyoxalase [Micromonospora pallida]
MTDPEVRPNETTVPLLPCVSPDETLAFYQALGFRVTYRQTRPYVYLAFAWSGFELHFGSAPPHVDPSQENAGGCLVMVDAVAPYHAAFSAAMRGAYGKVLARGVPRITRYRPGASRFTLVDPSGNSIIFIQRDEEETLEYGGSKQLQGIPRALDNARIFREFKNDDRAAVRTLTSALRRHGDTAPPVERALALAALAELAVALEEPDQADKWIAQLRTVELTDADRQRVENEVANVARLREWLTT